MKSFLTRSITLLRDTLSGRRTLAKYGDPEAHRRAAHNRDAAIANHYTPTSGTPPMGGLGM